jgi:Tol biopolymer transport system component
MRLLKILAFVFFLTVFTIPTLRTYTAQSQGSLEAPAGFDNLTNGFETQAEFDADRAAFEQRENIPDGLGPVYNAQSCAECHQNPVTGGISQITELRAGSTDASGKFVEAPGGSLIQARAIDPKIQERVPDTDELTFGTNINGTPQCGVVFDDGSFRFTFSPQCNWDSTWSPDGTKIAFSANHTVFVMNRDSSNVVSLLTVAGFPSGLSWQRLPGGANGKIGVVIFTASTYTASNIFTVNPDGSNLTQITFSPGTNDHLEWSPDGTRIAFQSTRDGNQEIYVMNADGSNQTRLTNDPSGDVTPTWSPDATKIAFCSNRHPSGFFQVYLLTNLGGVAPPTPLTSTPLRHLYSAWSPDGTKIAFDGTPTGGNRDLYVMNSDGTNETKITNSSGALFTSPKWSPRLPVTTRTFRGSLNLLGDGFVEAIDDSTLEAIALSQPPGMRGTVIRVPVLESPGCNPQNPSTCAQRVGRFGWKNSVASLLSFSALAYLGEMGITSPLQPLELTSLARPVNLFDTVADPEDTGGTQGFGEDVEAFARFIRSTKVPPRDRDLVPDDLTDPGSLLFNSLNCSVCHVRDIPTAPVGTSINGGTFTVPAALGNKIIHPFGDFLLHDLGTGDGIVETNGEATKNLVRTVPLWGLRTNNRLLHDSGGSSSSPTNNGAQSFTLTEAIQRHGGQAASSRAGFNALTPVRKAQLIRFLKSL